MRPALVPTRLRGSDHFGLGGARLRRLFTKQTPSRHLAPLSSAPLMNIHKGNHKIRIADHKLPYANYFPFYTVKRGSGGAEPPHTPRGGGRAPPAPPLRHRPRPRRHLGCGRAGAKMAGPNHFILSLSN